jgi:TIR domain
MTLHPLAAASGERRNFNRRVPTGSTWCAAMHELFISYCRHDSDAANALADTLSKAGLSVWLDRKAIQEGDAFDT